MNIFLACVETFISAAVVEGVCTLWVQAVSEGSAKHAGAYSLLWAIALLTGIGEALHFGLPTVTWVLGYGAGSYVAVKWNSNGGGK